MRNFGVAGFEATVRPVLVLGACGFIGRHVRGALARSALDGTWVGACRRPPRPAAARGAGGRWVASDLVGSPADEVETLVRALSPGAVVNCTDARSGSAVAMRTANVETVRSLLTVLADHPGTRLIQIGSSAEYGPQPTDAPVGESAVPHPCGGYARSKLWATDLVVAAIGHGLARGTVLRVFEPVGAGAPAGSFAGHTARALRDAGARGLTSITVGPLGTRLDVVAASDVGVAVVRALQAAELPPVLNVGRGVATSAAALVALLAAAAGFAGDVVERRGPVPCVASQRADVSLLQKTLDWVPTTSLAVALEELWSDLVGSSRRR